MFSINQPIKPQSRCKIRYRILLLAFIFSIGASNLVFSTPTAAKSCSDLQFIFARGSGEPLAGPSKTAWQTSIVDAIGKTSLKYEFYELGARNYGSYQYPAVAVAESFGGYLNLVGAFVSGGSAFEFGRSVEQGVGELKAYISSALASCPHTQFVLGGYSQGAMVLSRTLPDLKPQNILYVTTFGDPKLYLPEGESKIFGLIPKIPDACLGKNLSPYRIDVSDCRAYEGVLGSYRPYQPANYQGKIGTWCNGADIMCSSGLSIDDHTAYVSTNFYQDAAQKIVKKIQHRFGEHSLSHASTKSLREVVFLMDTTGSMSSHIREYSVEAKRLAQGIIDSGGRVALYQYGDLEDIYGAAQKLCDFGCSVAEFSEKIDSIRTKGGGDAPESTLSAALSSMNELRWSYGAMKSMIVLTDAGYHNPDRDATTFDDVVRRSFEIDPVNIYVITTDDVLPKYQTLAESTGGKTFNLGSETVALTDLVMSRPVAKLALQEYIGAVNDEFTFDASQSYADGGGDLHFAWDLDGDNIFELTSENGVIHQTYASPQNTFIQVKVTDVNGYTSTMSARLIVQPTDTDILTSISDLNISAPANQAVTINFKTDAERVLLSVGDAPIGFLPNVPGSLTKFSLGDLESDTSITLTPYSAAGQRGISATKAIKIGSSSAPSPSLPVTPSRPSASTTEQPDQPTPLPKAPNTGCVSGERRPSEN